jgi:hypothetical protein
MRGGHQKLFCVLTALFAKPYSHVPGCRRRSPRAPPRGSSDSGLAPSPLVLVWRSRRARATVALLEVDLGAPRPLLDELRLGR